MNEKFRHKWSPRLSRLRIAHASLPNLLQPFDNHSLARLDAFANNPIGPHSFSELHGAYGDSVRAIDDGELMGALEIDDRLLRNEKGRFLSFGGGPDAAILAWTQHVIGVRDQSRQPDRASPDIHL